MEIALNHREPDRVPIDFCITLNTYVRLPLDMIERLGLDMTFVRPRKPTNWKSSSLLAACARLFTKRGSIPSRKSQILPDEP